MSSEPVIKLGRPRQLYTGEKERPYIEIDKRDSNKKGLLIIKGE